MYVSAATLAMWSGMLPFWAALLAVPAGLILFMHLVLVKGGSTHTHLLPCAGSHCFPCIYVIQCWEQQS